MQNRLRRKNKLNAYIRKNRVRGGQEFYESKQDTRKRLLSAKMKRRGQLAAQAEKAAASGVSMTANPEKEAKFKRGKEIAEKRRQRLTARLQKKDEHIHAIRERREVLLTSKALDSKIKQEERATRVGALQLLIYVHSKRFAHMDACMLLCHGLL